MDGICIEVHLTVLENTELPGIAAVGQVDVCVRQDLTYIKGLRGRVVPCLVLQEVDFGHDIVSKDFGGHLTLLFDENCLHKDD